MAPGTVTLLQLRTQARQRSDMVNSTFVSDAEFNNYISNSYKELYDLLVSAFGNNYYVATVSTFVTDGTNTLYNLPTDFYKLLGVDLALSASLDSFVTIKPFNFSDRNRYAVPNFQSFYGVTNLRYRLHGNQLFLTPIPAASQTIRVWYIPEPTSVTSDSDSFDGISGWEEYVIVDAAIKALAKEESDVSVFMSQKEALRQRITSMADTRDAANPPVVADSQYGESWMPGNGGYTGGMY